MILAFPYHDPSGRHNEVFRRQMGTLQSTFSAVCVSVIPPTAQENGGFVQYLSKTGVSLRHAKEASFGDPSREALRMALIQSGGQQPILFGFLDRILFALETDWRDRFLSTIAAHQGDYYAVFERSEAAWDTHPSNYRELEQMVSRALELLCGRSIELSPGAFLLSPAAAYTILGQSTGSFIDVWGEWTLLALKNGIPVTTYKVDWLAWEDPFWERTDPAQLRCSRDASREETVKRIAWSASLMQLLAEERFRELGRDRGQKGASLR